MTPLDPLTLAPAAFLAGLLMFLAPCTLPLVPGYLAFIAGVPEAAVKNMTARMRIFWNALAFVLGFSIIFILLGTFAGVLGSAIGPWRMLLGRGAGLIIILFGLTMLGWVRIPYLSSTGRVRIPHFIALGRPESSFLVGVLFAIGWSPCIGPILGTILLVASTNGTAAAGALLLGIFSLGLGLPFLITALLLGEIGNLFTRWGRFVNVLETVGGVVLLILGVLMLMGQMELLLSWGYGLFDWFHYDRLLQYM